MDAVTYAHIELREGIPYLIGTQTKVVEVVLDRLAYGWEADEIHRQHPHLSLGQIHSCLAYYYDHQEEMGRDIAEREKRVQDIREEVQASQGESPVQKKLKDLGLIP